MRFTIGAVQKTSLLDYPDKISAIVFTRGCNFNCGYCHNPSLLSFTTENSICNTDAVFDFLKKRQGKLDGVVITGGEPSLQPDLKLFIQKIKELNFLVKLDTNGSRPDIILDLIKNNLIDYIAMDIKAPLEKYAFVAGVDIDTSKIQNSIDIIMNSHPDYEFRTTVLPSMLQFEDFEKIGKLIKNAKRYYLQKFVVQSSINNPNLENEKNYSDKEFESILMLLQKYVQYAALR